MRDPNETPQGPQPHFVLCQGDKSPGPELHKKRWRDHIPTPEQLEAHLAADPTHKAGLVPASIGLVAIDCDGGHFKAVQDAIQGKFHFIPFPSSTPGNGHLWMRAEDPSQWAGNSQWGIHPPKEVRDDPQAMAEWPHPHGEIRSDAGFIAFRDKRTLDALLAIAKSIAPSGFTRNELDSMYGKGETAVRPKESLPGHGSRRRASLDELRDQLERLPQSACEDYETWYRMMAASKHECGDAGREIVRRWSMKSAKYDKRKFDTTWDSFKRAGDAGRVAKWGSVVHEAGGFNAKRRDDSPEANGEPNVGGRPRHDDPNHAARMGRARRASAAINDLLLDTDAPEPSDAHRILELCRERLLRVNSVNGPYAMVRTPNGLWIDLEHRRTDAATGALGVTLKLARERALAHGRSEGYDEDALKDIEDFWTRGDTARFKGDLARQLAQRITGGEVTVATINETQLNHGGRMIPLTDQVGAWLVSEGRILTPDEAAEHHATDLGWGIPTPDPRDGTEGAALMDAMLDGRYHDFWQRAAAWISGVAKNVDILIAHRSSWGKTTFFRLYGDAFPGMVKRLDARTAYNQSSSRFTPTARYLTTTAALMLDEVGHLDDELPVAVFNSHTDDEVTVERKGKDARTQLRMGTLVLAGHKAPPVNTTAQGVDTRVTFVHEVPEDAEPMSSEERAALIGNPDAAARFRWRVLTLAKELYESGGPDACWTRTVKPRHREAVMRFLEGGVPHEIRALWDEFQAGTGQDWVSTAALEEVVQGALGVQKVAPKTFGGTIRKAFPEAVRKRGTQADSNGKKAWGYSGIAMKNDDSWGF